MVVILFSLNLFCFLWFVYLFSIVLSLHSEKDPSFLFNAVMIRNFLPVSLSKQSRVSFHPVVVLCAVGCSEVWSPN
jgi:hypothetical protein